MTEAGQPDLDHQQPPWQRLLELLLWRPRSWGMQHVLKSQAAIVAMAKDAASMEHHFESTDDSVSNLHSNTFLSFCGGGPQVGGADHLRPVDQRAVCWRGLHIEHIQGSLQNGETVFSQVCTPSTLTHPKQPAERGKLVCSQICTSSTLQPAETFLQLSAYVTSSLKWGLKDESPLQSFRAACRL